MTVEEIRAQREQCADCGGALEEIFVLDSQTVLVGSKKLLAAQKPVRWLRATFQNISKRDRYVAEGNVLTFRCAHCGRISFYGADF